ncbi:MAG: tRNA pseudouridine(55) synthase TruB, partial [Treponema sp.]|nr:tRNA pseudouridine(55) synthase TruB [Treponema sp.]
MRAPEASAEKTGLLLLNKSPGLTSFESLYLVKKALATPKVGHTGTLDKFASGLLLVLVGRALKLCPWFSGCDKRYEAVIRFGVETDTLDPEGSPVARGEAPSPAALEAAMALFRGELLQTPPAYSAVHVGGERAYKLARSGRAVEMRQRPVTIYGLELSSYDPPLASIRVHCSAGTYIRSLARDIALAAGSRGHLSALNRTQVAGFKLE